MDCAETAETANRQALRLFCSLAGAGHPDVLLCPLSISRAVHLAAAAATEGSRGERELLEFSPSFISPPRQRGDVTLELATSLWRTGAVRPAFASRMEELGVAVRAAPSSAAEINDWVAEATHGRITSVVDSTPQNLVAMLLDAAYFNAPWKHKFDAGDSRPAPFQGMPEPIMSMSIKREFLFADVPFSLAEAQKRNSSPVRGGSSSMPAESAQDTKRGGDDDVDEAAEQFPPGTQRGADDFDEADDLDNLVPEEMQRELDALVARGFDGPQPTAGKKRHVQVVQLPYGDGEDFAAVIVLPSADITLDDVVGALRVGGMALWRYWLDSLRCVDLDPLQLPRFRLDFETSLQAALAALGVKTAFAANRDDPPLLRLTDDPEAYIENIIHKTALEVSEEGTVAAAVTSLMIETLCLKPNVPMVVDRPFLFAVRHVRSGYILFVGRVDHPKEI